MSLIRLSFKGSDQAKSLEFTDRELQVLATFLNSKNQKDLATKLNLKEKTVKHYMRWIFHRIGIKGIGQLWQYLVREEWIDICPDTDVLTIGGLPIGARKKTAL